MTAIREIIIAAVEAALASGTEAVEIERMPSGDPAAFPALHIMDFGQRQLAETEAGASRFDMALSIEGYVQGTGGAAVHAAMNKLQADTVRSVMALQDTGVAGLEIVEPEDLRVATVELGSARRIAFAQDFSLQFVTRRGDPEQ